MQSIFLHILPWPIHFIPFYLIQIITAWRPAPVFPLWPDREAPSAGFSQMGSWESRLETPRRH